MRVVPIRVVMSCTSWIRQFGEQKFESNPETVEKIKARHCRYYAAWLQPKELLLKSTKQYETLAEIDAEIDNIRLAWNWAATHGLGIELDQAVGTLYYFYEIRCWFQEGIAALNRAVVGLETAEVEPHLSQQERDVLLGRILARLGGFYGRVIDYDKARELAHRSLSLFRRYNAKKQLPLPYLVLGNVAETVLEGKQYYEKSLVCAQDAEDLWGVASALGSLSSAIWKTGRSRNGKSLPARKFRFAPGNW